MSDTMNLIKQLIKQLQAEHQSALYWRRLFFMMFEPTPF